jgi:hypothetical protein
MPPLTGAIYRADQQPCQNGLVLEDHSGGYQIEPLRPDRAIYQNWYLRRVPIMTLRYSI